MVGLLKPVPACASGRCLQTGWNRNKVRQLRVGGQLNGCFGVANCLPGPDLLALLILLFILMTFEDVADP